MDASSAKDANNKVYDVIAIPVTFMQKNTIIKYTKIPDFDVNAQWTRPLQIQPRSRQIIELHDVNLQTSHSLNMIPSHIVKRSPATNKKVIIINEDEESDLHPKFYKKQVKASSRSTSTNINEDNKVINKIAIKDSPKGPKSYSAKLNSVNYNKDISVSKLNTRSKLNSSRNDSLSNRNNRVNYNKDTRVSELYVRSKVNSSRNSVSNRNNSVNYNKDTGVSEFNVRSKLNSSRNDSVSNRNNSVNYNKDTGVSELNVRSKVNSSRNDSVSNSTRSTNSNYKKEKDQLQTKNNQINLTTKVSIRKNVRVPALTENKKEIILLKKELNHSSVSAINNVEKRRSTKYQPNKSTVPKKDSRFMKEVGTKKPKPVSVIRVPLDPVLRETKNKIKDSVINDSTPQVNIDKKTVNAYVNTFLECKDVDVNTDSLPIKTDETTETDIETTKYKPEEKVHKEDTIRNFDNLDIPNVTLVIDRNDASKDEIVKFHSTSLPNLRIPSVTITSLNEKSSPIEKNPIDCSQRKSTSFIIGRATLTYTTKQKINFHVCSNDETVTPSLTPSPLAYPFNVVSIFKREITKTQRNDVSHFNEKYNKEKTNQLSRLKCSYDLNRNKLVKPSDIIGTIRLNNSLLENNHICEQFRNELNFIDSYFESLQYLESCALAEKCLAESKCENWLNNSGLDVENSGYVSFLSKLENGANDTETMASKSLCLLNLLIRDEQRRAKNLLFVLKMREDALKDFTKSQILWLENKKKQENTDISTLIKKQRGALLKLQHECGEMQRMRKALLALSEKRKAALIKTKRDIELKLRNSFDVAQILKEKKKLKRCLSSERTVAPIKCFELSSSCDESTSVKKTEKVEPVLLPPEISPSNINYNLEKSIQTGESILGSLLIDQSTGTDENSVAVDGGYLNILFSNLSLQQIFSSGKQYEVNEEALKSIVNTAISHHKINENEVDNFMENLKNREEVSSPSTARSLVEELDQYYKGLNEDDSSDSTLVKYYEADNCESKDDLASVTESHTSVPEGATSGYGVSVLNNSLDVEDTGSERYVVPEEPQPEKAKELNMVATQTGPLPVPVGTSADSSEEPSKKIFDSDVDADIVLISSIPTLSPVYSEAEELRRQQLAIEREIKALEQQQSQLLVVREIPDKPPPPYKPPQDPKLSKPPRIFHIEAATYEKIEKLVTQPEFTTIFTESVDTFESFLRDFCEESVRWQKAQNSDKPWDACNLLPQKPEMEPTKLVERTSTYLKEVLTGVPPVTVSGVSSRRSDHIDDILFTEWRRCEPEWTSLHTDEALVKNQVYESIFQKVLNDTICEYKKTVVSNE